MRGMGLVSILMVLVMFVGVFGGIIGSFNFNVSAVPDTHTWDGGGADAFAGTHANWVGDVAPEAGDSIIFNAGALPCTWNLSIALATFTIAAGYTGMVTQAADFECTSWTQNAGTWTGNVLYSVTCHGSVNFNGGTFTEYVTNFVMEGVGDFKVNLRNIHCFTMAPGATTTMLLKDYLIDTHIGPGANMILSDGSQVDVDWNAGVVFENYGTISGNGVFRIRLWDIDRIWAPGNITTSVYLFAGPTCTGNRTFFLGGDYTFQKDLIVHSFSSTYSMTLHHGSNYTMTVAGNVTLGKYAINPIMAYSGTMIQGTGVWSFGSYAQFGLKSVFNATGTIICNGNWDSSGGTFVAGTSTVNISGTNTIRTKATSSFYNLEINGTTNCLSSLNVTNNLNISDSGVLTQNGRLVNVSGSSMTPLTGYGTFDGNLYLNGSIASSYEIQTGLPMGFLHTDRDTKISLDSNRYLQVVPSIVEFVNVSIESYGTEQGYDARWMADSTNPVTYTVRLGANLVYEVWVGHAIRIAILEAGPSGIIQFTYNGPFSPHEFTISRSGGPSNNLVASFEYIIDGFDVFFTEKSQGGPTVFYWNFGDGYGSTERNPAHKYVSSGTYAIKLTIYDSQGRSSSAQTSIKLVLGSDNPIERGEHGWNIYLTKGTALSVSALGLIILGSVMFVSAVYLPKIPFPITTKGRKIIGMLMVVAGIYYYLFIESSWWGGQ